MEPEGCFFGDGGQTRGADVEASTAGDEEYTSFVYLRDGTRGMGNKFVSEETDLPVCFSVSESNVSLRKVVNNATVRQR